MSPKNKRILFTSLISIIVFILLLSNLGNNFKTDIISYKNIINNVDNIKSNWLSSYNEEDFCKISSDYIVSNLEEYSLKTTKQNFSYNIPIEKSKSYLEVISKYDNTIKQYTYKEDFTEDISGLYTSQYVKGNGRIIDEIEFKDSIPDIILFEKYATYPNYLKETYDKKLKALGVSAVLFPEAKEKILDNSSFFDSEYTKTSNGILKFAVSHEAYKEIEDYINQGYKLKLKSGIKVEKQNLINVYGKIEGSNPKYPPLIIGTFYDGQIPSKFNSTKGDTFEVKTYTPSILIECARIAKIQENIVPDRTIIFAFLSGKNSDEKGLDYFKSLKLKGDFILLDNLGNSNKFNLLVHEKLKNLTNTIDYFMKKNDLKIVSNTTSSYMNTGYTYISGLNNLDKGLDFTNSYNTCKFILSLIGDECYNLDLITANSREIRGIRRFLNDYTVLISVTSLIFITYIVFKYPEIKKF